MNILFKEKYTPKKGMIVTLFYTKIKREIMEAFEIVGGSIWI
jgi:hypothetical protein